MDEKTRGYVMILAAIGLWSTIEVVSKYIQGDVRPLSIAFVRFGLGALMLLPYGLYKYRGHRIDRKTYLHLLLSGFLGITVTFTLFHLSLETVRASTAATIIASVPLFVLPLSVILLQDKLTPRVVSAVGLGLVGIFVLSAGELQNPGSLGGILLLLGALVSFSIFNVYNKHLGKKIHPATATGISIAFGTLMFIPIIVATRTPFIPSIPALSWLPLLYLGFLATGAGYLLYFTGLDKVETARGSSLFYLKPVFALVLAIILLGEPLLLLSIAGIAIVVLSVRIALAP